MQVLKKWLFMSVMEEGKENLSVQLHLSLR
jgi:hypothetical protein